jgi:hypothetical protein
MPELDVFAPSSLFPLPSSLFPLPSPLSPLPSSLFPLPSSLIPHPSPSFLFPLFSSLFSSLPLSLIEKTETVSLILKEQGLLGFFKGLGPQLFGFVPSWAIYFTVYDHFKPALTDITGGMKGGGGNREGGREKRGEGRKRGGCTLIF